MQADEIKRLIETNMADAQVSVQGDDGVHFQATVISPAFVGKTLVQQHQLVYQALQGRMENQEIHALGLKTYTPDAWQAVSGS